MPIPEERVVAAAASASACPLASTSAAAAALSRLLLGRLTSLCAHRRWLRRLEICGFRGAVKGGARRRRVHPRQASGGGGGGGGAPLAARGRGLGLCVAVSTFRAVMLPFRTRAVSAKARGLAGRVNCGRLPLARLDALPLAGAAKDELDQPDKPAVRGCLL